MAGRGLDGRWMRPASGSRTNVQNRSRARSSRRVTASSRHANMCSYAVRRAALPLRLLLPRRRVAARGARRRRAEPRPRGARAHRPRLAVGLDGVRAGGEGARAAGDPRRGGDARRARRRRAGAPPHAARPRRDRLAQPLPAADEGARAHARRTAARPQRPRGRRRRRRAARRRARLPQRLRDPRRARRADDAPPARRASAAIACASSCSARSRATTAR